MKAVILLGFWVMTSLSGFAQPVDSLWSRMYGGFGNEECRAIKQTSDGGYVLAGMKNYSETDIDMWLLKTDSNGNVVWELLVGGGLTEKAFDVVERSEGGYAMVGYTVSYGAGGSDIYFVRVSASGAIEGISIWGGAFHEWGNSIQQTSDGGFIVGGETNSLGAGLSDFWLIKTDAAGVEEWSQTYGGTNYDICNVVKQTPDGGYALAGSTSSIGPNFEERTWLIKTNSSGQTTWSRSYVSPGGGYAYDMVHTSDGGFALAGVFYSPGSFVSNFYLVKADAIGTLQWSRSYGGSLEETCKSIVQTPDGGFILAGYTNSFGSGFYDYWILRAASNGDSLWSKTFGGPSTEICNAIIQTIDGRFMLAGGTYSFGAAGEDMWMVKTGPDLISSSPEQTTMPSQFSLHPIYPNPFNNTANIVFDLPREVTGRLVVYDVLGREMKTLFDGRFTSGSHSLQLNADNFSSGTYFVRMETPTFSATQKAVLVK